ncbi:hypothetical protein KIPB_007003 [Kipferlia bialata]|uniref:C3H1-type domain-containing protein n=1 Tax=Kipferlia bialata TaxID=797122 RepID=A0A9K3CXW1_9EUKA|nr:hypothetical protein KIPB_007003 [Kipferlia bialata]|eukprot:g7003.t1
MGDVDPKNDFERRMTVMLEDDIDLGIKKGALSYLIGSTVVKRPVVCKHYVRGLCKRGDKCQFLHIYDLAKMTSCRFYRYGSCNNPECEFRHVDPDADTEACPYYSNAYCRTEHCLRKHVYKPICPQYLAGFCPDGPSCLMGHPKWELPVTQNVPVSTNPDEEPVQRVPEYRVRKICQRCGQAHDTLGDRNQCPPLAKLVSWGDSLFVDSDARELARLTSLFVDSDARELARLTRTVATGASSRVEVAEGDSREGGEGSRAGGCR